jgi:photosystem II stability/assembly factor-like uncharacterized protein
MKKFEPYKLLQPYGMTDITDPTGGLTAVREPDPGQRRVTRIVDIVRGEPGLPTFQLDTRLKTTLNFMLGLRDRCVNMQAHLGSCDRADNYFASQIALHWEAARRGDLGIDRLSLIEGDDQPIAITVPWSASLGPLLLDFQTEFLSARTIAETEAITDMAFLNYNCGDCADAALRQDPGEHGYAVTEALAGSLINVANVWYTTDAGQTWLNTSTRPFAGGEDISSVVVSGTKKNHRVIVARGTTDADDPAEIAYADVTVFGTTSWVNVNVGSVDGQYITRLFWGDYGHLFAVTDDGYIYFSANGGATWDDVLTTGVQQFNDVSALDDGTVFVVGNSNTVYMSEDYGDSWSAVTGPSAGDDLLTVHVTPDGTVFVGNDAGEVYGSYDDGDEWHSLAPQGVTATAITRIRGVGNDNIWMTVTTASGGRALRSVDGGASFRLWNLNMPTNSGLNALAVIDHNLVYVGGEPQGGSAFISKTTTQVIGV